MLKVDKDDVPLLIQNLTYSHIDMLFEFKLFNSNVEYAIPAEAIMDIDIMQKDVSSMQMLQAENELNKYVLKYWKKHKLLD